MTPLTHDVTSGVALTRLNRAQIAALASMSARLPGIPEVIVRPPDRRYGWVLLEWDGGKVSLDTVGGAKYLSGPEAVKTWVKDQNAKVAAKAFAQAAS